MLIPSADHRRNGYPKDHRRLPQRFPDRMVRFGLLPDCFFIYITMGQALQVFQSEVDLPGVGLHL